MLTVPSFESVRAIGKFLLDAGYDLPTISGKLDLIEGLSPNLENLAPLLAKTEGDSLLHFLARLFFVAWPVSAELCEKFFPQPLLNSAFAAGLLQTSPDGIASVASLVPGRHGRIVACDARRLLPGDPDLVIGPSQTTNLVSRMAVGGHQETTLDVGTGTGVLAFEALLYSKSVVGVDINPRAIAFARFNAALNGLADIEFLCGDCFSPVQGRRFTRIIANPPFFLSPAKKYTYSDSPLELDGFSRRLAKEAPDYLSEGGYFQMLCEWVEVEGQPWEERIREWTHNSGCDVLILMSPRTSPIAYSEKRANEVRKISSDDPANSFTARLSFFRERNVKNIFGGVINMRKRQGLNWSATIAAFPESDAGATVRERFACMDFLASHTTGQLLASKFRLAPDAGLDQRFALLPDGWSAVKTDISKDGPLRDQLRLDAIVANFIPLFDGQHSGTEIAAIVAESLGLPSEEATQRVLQLTRRLLQSSFILPA